MHRRNVSPLIVICTLLLGACSTPTPEPTATPTVTSTPVPPTATPTHTPEPTPSPTPEPTESTGIPVEITLTDNVIRSSLNTFQAGVSYTFVISNRARHEHNFIIAPPVSLAGGYAEALAQALLAVDETEVPPGTTFTVDFTFPESAVGATLEFSCLIKRHYEDGMRLDITVTN